MLATCTDDGATLLVAFSYSIVFVCENKQYYFKHGLYILV